MGTIIAAALAVAGFAAASAQHRPTASVELRYGSQSALAAFVRSEPVKVVRVIAALHIAEVRPLDSPTHVIAAARRAPGIRFARAVAARAAAATPALALGAISAPAGGAYEWQYYAAGVERVPPAVLAAARGITIAVVDTGADLGAAGLGAKVTATYDTRTGGRDVTDASGHGTFVASLAAGSTTEGAGIAGFGGEARLLIVKAGTAARFNDVDVAAGIVYATQHGARIITVSVAGTTKSPVEAAAVQYAARHGVLVVAAAGNDALGGNRPEYPAALLQPVGSNGRGGLGLSVGASDYSGTRASFSEFGSFVSLAAPGVSVFGALPSTGSPSFFQRAQLPGAAAGAYGFASGTSFAAPEVAGAAALVWAANPSLSVSRVASILEQTASGNGVWGPELGFGVLDVGRAVAAATA